jgi:hypothetical protein
MKWVLLCGVSVLAVAASTNSSRASDVLGKSSVTGEACDPWVDYDCVLPKLKHKPAQCDPYLDYSCLDSYLGSNFFERFAKYYVLEWGKAVAPADPKAPPSSRPEALWPPVPQSTPPMPYTEWPYGGTQNIAATVPNSVDSPLMAALGNTEMGKALNAAHVQIYGWVDPAGNISSNNVKPGGNLPVSYDFTPNAIQLDQAVVYFERVPDEVQNDHFDWGFRFAPIYGSDYRYTYAYGYFSGTLNKANLNDGFDIPMLYADLYYPVMGGLNVRIGRFISIPDIEAQLAPNNYTYVHSLTYTFDNYTNEGVQATLAITKNWILQLGSTVGTEAPPWHYNVHIPNADPNPLYPANSFQKDPGAVPSFTIGLRWTSSDGNDDLNVVADGINAGQQGYNNLQWLGLTYYHKINNYWHWDFETWNIHSFGVPNYSNPAALAALAASGNPLGGPNVPFNGPNFAFCGGSATWGGNYGTANNVSASNPMTCTADAQTFLLYINYSPDKLNNFSLRTEWFDDHNGFRTGVPTRYVDIAWGWQHWLSPQIELRPEIGYYRSLDVAAFNGNPDAAVGPTRSWSVIAASDIIIHF